MKLIQRLCKEGSGRFLILTFLAVAVGMVIAVGIATAVAWPTIVGGQQTHPATAVNTAGAGTNESEAHPKSAWVSATGDDVTAITHQSKTAGGAVLVHGGISGSVQAADYAETHQWLR
jgi:hypothetical protein